MRVSLCLIVKDEEVNLPDCLAGVHELFDDGHRRQVGVDADEEVERAVGAGDGAELGDGSQRAQDDLAGGGEDRFVTIGASEIPPRPTVPAGRPFSAASGEIAIS